MNKSCGRKSCAERYWLCPPFLTVPFLWVPYLFGAGRDAGTTFTVPDSFVVLRQTRRSRPDQGSGRCRPSGCRGRQLRLARPHGQAIGVGSTDQDGSRSSAIALNTSAPRLMPLSKRMVVRSPTASATAGNASRAARPPSSCRPPWFDTITPATPSSTARRASSA